jgi:hypothetical protein
LRRFTEGWLAWVRQDLERKLIAYSRCRRQQAFSWLWQYRKPSKSRLDFFIPGHNSTVRINGRAKVIDRNDLTDRKLAVFDPDEKAEVLQGLLVEVEESYSHCPRALKFSRLWNVDEISKNIADPPVGLKEPGI